MGSRSTSLPSIVRMTLSRDGSWFIVAYLHIRYADHFDSVAVNRGGKTIVHKCFCFQFSLLLLFAVQRLEELASLHWLHILMHSFSNRLNHCFGSTTPSGIVRSSHCIRQSRQTQNRDRAPRSAFSSSRSSTRVPLSAMT